MCALPSLLCRLALCCLIVLCASCGAAADAPLRLGTNIWLGFEPFYVARKQNQLPSSVRLVEYASGAEVLSAFRNRSIDLAAVTLDEAISLAEHDASLRVGLVLDHSNGADALVARPDIRQLADLKGRSVGVESFGVGGIPQRLMDAFAEELGDYDKTHKILILTTQVTYEGSDVGIYEVGKRVKNRFRFLEAHDMTIEAVVTKVMWLLAQNCENFDQLQQRFYRQINFDTFYH